MSKRNVNARSIVEGKKKREILRGTKTGRRKEIRGRGMNGKGGITGEDTIMVGIGIAIQMLMLMPRITMVKEMHVELLKMARERAIGNIGIVEGMMSTRLEPYDKDNLGNLLAFIAAEMRRSIFRSRGYLCKSFAIILQS